MPPRDFDMSRRAAHPFPAPTSRPDAKIQDRGIVLYTDHVSVVLAWDVRRVPGHGLQDYTREGLQKAIPFLLQATA